MDKAINQSTATLKNPRQALTVAHFVVNDDVRDTFEYKIILYSECLHTQITYPLNNSLQHHQTYNKHTYSYIHYIHHTYILYLSLEQMHADKRFDDALSGTTAISILLRGKTMFISNVGDSRAIVISSAGDRLVAKPLSVDQTPYRKVIPLYLLLLLCVCIRMHVFYIWLLL